MYAVYHVLYICISLNHIDYLSYLSYWTNTDTDAGLTFESPCVPVYTRYFRTAAIHKVRPFFVISRLSNSSRTRCDQPSKVVQLCPAQ